MYKLQTLTLDGSSIAINIDYIVKIEEREGRDGNPHCTILLSNGQTHKWLGKLSVLVAELVS